MIRTLVICCDWPGCTTELTIQFRTLRPEAPGWRTECDSPYSLHLCPTHARKSWHSVREAQTGEVAAPDTGRYR